MTIKQLREWLFTNSLDDQWWLCIDDSVDSSLVILLDVENVLVPTFHGKIQVLHVTQSELTNPPWVDVENPHEQFHAAMQLPVSVQDSPKKVLYIKEKDHFHGTLALVMKLAAKAVQSAGYKLDSANDSIGLVTFSTGISWNSFSGMSCSLQIEEVSSYYFRVHGAGKQNPAGLFRLSLDLTGEAVGTAKKVISKMKTLAC